MKIHKILLKRQKIGNYNNLFGILTVETNHGTFYFSTIENYEDRIKEEEKPIFPIDLIPPKGITTFYAANTTEKSYDHPDAKNGIFTYYMLKGLKGDADNGDKVITVGELHDYIRKNVLDTTKNLYSNLPQTPQLYTENPDRVLLRLP